MLATLIERWGYLAVALGTLVEGEGTLLAAGALAHKGLLGLPGIYAAAFVGTMAANQLWFWVGRRYGAGFVAQRPKLAAPSRRVEQVLSRYGALFVLSLRFLLGLRTASVVWLGSSGFSYRRFLVLDTVGAAVWAAVIGALGWGVGASLKQLLGRTSHVEELLLGGLIVALLGCGVKSARSRRARRAAASSR